MKNGKSRQRKDRRAKKLKSMSSLNLIPMTIALKKKWKEPMTRTTKVAKKFRTTPKRTVELRSIQVMKHITSLVRPTLPMIYLNQKPTKKQMLHFSLIIGIK